MSSHSFSIYPLSPRNIPVNGFRGDTNAANSCDSLRILEPRTEFGHLAVGAGGWGQVSGDTNCN